MFTTDRKIVLALQFWEGDRARAMHLARFIADLCPEPNPAIEFAFVARFDCAHDPETVQYVRKKFRTHELTGRRTSTGWPAGCNDLALDLLQQSARLVHTGIWKNVSALYLIESDVMPLCRDWIEKLSVEWEQARAEGKLLLGAWCPFHGGSFGHINGNAIFHPEVTKKIFGIDRANPKKGWDADLAELFAPHWKKSRQMSNNYDYRSAIPEEVLFACVDGVTSPVVAHGTKDFSAELLVRDRLGM